MNRNMPFRGRWTPTRFAIVALILALALGWSGYRLAVQFGHDVSTPGSKIGGSYRLISLSEGTVTEGSFLGSWVLVWFFDTHCPKQLCGPVLKTMSDAKLALNREGVRVVPLAITLDPLHDVADALGKYALPLGDHVVPLTGAPRMIKKVAGDFRAPNELVRADDGTSYHLPAPRVVIIDPQGRYAGTVDAKAGTEALVVRIHQLAHRG